MSCCSFTTTIASTPSPSRNCPSSCGVNCHSQCPNDCCAIKVQSAATSPLSHLIHAPPPTAASCPETCPFSCYPECSTQCCSTPTAQIQCPSYCPAVCRSYCTPQCCATGLAKKSDFLSHLRHLYFLRRPSMVNTFKNGYHNHHNYRD